MELIIEIAMDGERELYKEESGDVSNGYRPRRIFASGNMLELRCHAIGRGFMPFILGVLKSQEKGERELASYPYSYCGNSMENISGAFEHLYGK